MRVNSSLYVTTLVARFGGNMYCDSKDAVSLSCDLARSHNEKVNVAIWLDFLQGKSRTCQIR